MKSNQTPNKNVTSSILIKNQDNQIVFIIMKKKTILFLVGLFAFIAGALADNVVVDGVTIEQGGSATLNIEFIRTQNDYMGFEMKLSLPEGLTVTEKSAKLGSRFDGMDHTLGMTRLKEGEDAGKYQFISLSFSGSAIPENEGTLFSAELKADPSLKTGSYQATLSGIEFPTTSSEKVMFDDVTFTINVTGSAGPMVLEETSVLVPEATKNEVELMVKRTIKAGVWNTLCLPFNMTTSQLKEAFGADVQLAEFKDYDAEYGDDDSVTGITVNFEDVDLNKEGLFANYPYLIKTSKEVGEFSLTTKLEPDEENAVAEYDNGKKGKQREVYGRFIGTLHAGEYVPADDLFAKDNNFYYSTGITTIKAFRAYLWLDDVLSEASMSVGLSIRVDGEATLVEELTTAADDANVYDLSGRKVQSEKNLEKGVYIVGDKKTIVK